MTIRIGIIGTGWVSQLHIDSLKKIPDVQVVAVAGRNIDRVNELAKSVNGKAYEDYRQMLSKERLDAAFILLPPHLHGEIEKACVEYVPAVLVEKPICNNLQQALEIEKMFSDAKTIVSVGYMNRYRNSLKLAKKLFSVQEHKPVLVNGWWVSEAPPPMWWRNMEQSGGQFNEQCTHVYDAARYVLGDITEVSAYSTKGFVTDISDYTVDDAMTVNVRFKSGAIGNFTTGCFPANGYKGSDNDIGLIISSRDTKCQVSGWGMNLLTEHPDVDTSDFDSEDNIFTIQNKAFIKAIVEKNPEFILSSYSDAIKTLKVGLAANESCKTGKTVII